MWFGHISRFPSKMFHSIWSQFSGCKGHLDNLEDGKAAGDDHHCDFWLVLFCLKETVRPPVGGSENLGPQQNLVVKEFVVPC